ncbi:MAG: hydrocarbon-binding protein [Nostocales cyanobacterium]|nr:MAG: hydrocarbon-binding protein [Nostocales cyanobacterium]
MPESLRPQLGDFSSIVCFKAVVIGIEEALGEKAAAIALTTAGRSRGKQIVESLGLSGSVDSLDVVQVTLSQAVGKDGTRLCIIDKIVTEGDTIKVYTHETVCSAGEAQGSERKCTFTLGAVWGALEQILDKRLRGVHTESVLRGGTHDVFEFTNRD